MYPLYGAAVVPLATNSVLFVPVDPRAKKRKEEKIIKRWTQKKKRRRKWQSKTSIMKDLHQRRRPIERKLYIGVWIAVGTKRRHYWVHYRTRGPIVWELRWAKMQKQKLYPYLSGMSSKLTECTFLVNTKYPVRPTEGLWSNKGA